MRWRPQQPWFGPSPRGKVQPVSGAGYLVLFGTIALVMGLIALGRALPHLLIIALALALTIAALVVVALAYGSPQPPAAKERPADPPRP